MCTFMNHIQREMEEEKGGGGDTTTEYIMDFLILFQSFIDLTRRRDETAMQRALLYALSFKSTRTPADF